MTIHLSIDAGDVLPQISTEDLQAEILRRPEDRNLNDQMVFDYLANSEAPDELIAAAREFLFSKIPDGSSLAAWKSLCAV